ncbi:hypothetical protein D9M71_218050 [compost metagenome]
MALATEETAAAVAEQLHPIVLIAGKPSRIADEELDLFFLQVLHRLLPVLHLERHADRRVRRDEGRQGLGNQALCGEWAAGETQFAGGQAFELVQFVAQRTGSRQQPAGMLQHQFALGGQTELAAATVDQDAAEVALQHLDAATERRLAETDRIRRALEVAGLGQRDKMPELAELAHACLASGK